MTLRDIANEALAGFDPKNDKIESGNSGLPAGEYTALVDNISHSVFKSGWDAFSTKFQVVEGDFTGRVENVNISFAETAKSGKAIPDFVLDRNIKFVSKLGELLGIDITGEDFGGETETEIHEHLSNKLREKVGVVVTLKVIQRPNKNDPSSPYVSYDLDAAEQPQEIEVDDNEMPFGDSPLPPEDSNPESTDKQSLPFD